MYKYIYIYINILYIYTLEESPPLEPLGPHFEDLGQHFGSILDPFWQPLDTLGTTLGAIGHHLGNLVDPRVKISSCGDPRGQLMFQFGVHLGATFSQKSHIFFKKWLPTTTPQSRVVFMCFFCNFNGPRTLNIELPPAREHDFQKTT